MSSSRGIPSLKPYSYHFCVGKSGYRSSRAPQGPLAPRSGCPPASICIDSETTNRAPSGQKASRDARCCAAGFAAIAIPNTEVSFMKFRRSIVSFASATEDVNRTRFVCETRADSHYPAVPAQADRTAELIELLVVGALEIERIGPHPIGPVEDIGCPGFLGRIVLLISADSLGRAVLIRCRSDHRLTVSA